MPARDDPPAFIDENAGLPAYGLDDDRDELEDLMDELDAEEREAERLSRQATLYSQSPKRGDHG